MFGGALGAVTASTDRADQVLHGFEHFFVCFLFVVVCVSGLVGVVEAVVVADTDMTTLTRTEKKCELKK